MPKKSKYKQFPKKKIEGGGAEVDVDKVHDEYIHNPHYSWTHFCKSAGYNPEANKSQWYMNRVNFSEWKQDWVRQNVAVMDEEILPDMVDITRVIATQRVKFVKDWVKRTQFMKQLFDALLNRDGDNLKRDMAMREQIEKGLVRPMFHMDYDELNKMAAVGQKLQELERASLLFAPEHKSLKRASDEISVDDPIPEIDVQTLGNVMGATESAQLIASYFDQFEAKPEAPAEAGKDAEEDSV